MSEQLELLYCTNCNKSTALDNDNKCTVCGQTQKGLYANN